MRTERSTGAGAAKLALYSALAMTGKSSRGSVARLKLDRPACTFSRPSAPSVEIDTSAPSGP